VSRNVEIQVCHGCRAAVCVSVCEEVTLFKRGSMLPCVRWIVVVDQRCFLLFGRRELIAVLPGYKQRWKQIRHIWHTSLSTDIIIIIIGKTALFEPQPSLDDSATLHPVFTSLDFATIIIL
jgi:hypothetical protein